MNENEFKSLTIERVGCDMNEAVDEFWVSFHRAIRNIKAVKGMADKVFRGQTRDYQILPSIARNLEGGKKSFLIFMNQMF